LKEHRSQPARDCQDAGGERDDGFQGVYDMMQWFEKTHGTPLSGTLIEWSVIAPMPEGQEKP